MSFKSACLAPPSARTEHKTEKEFLFKSIHLNIHLTEYFTASCGDC